MKRSEEEGMEFDKFPNNTYLSIFITDISRKFGFLPQKEN
jgi:hypothetical protein